jgi:PKD repeat protein
MKKSTLKLFVITLLALFGVATQAQTIILGTGTAVNGTSSASPINEYYRSLHCQMVYTKAELNAAGVSGPGTFTQLGFYITGGVVYALPNWTIKMKNTVATNAAVYDGIGLTTVHNIASYNPPVGNWDLLTLNTPFLWNGVDNILVDVCFDQAANWTSAGQVRVYPTVSGLGYVRSDLSSQCGVSTSNVSTDKPQVKLTFQPSSPIDLGVQSMLQPSTTGCYGAAQTVRFRIKSYGTATVDFSLNPLVLTSYTTGANPTTFPTLTINSGTLASNATLDTTVTTTYNMTTQGTYTFNATATVIGDGYTGNDAMVPATINVSAGNATVNNPNICGGNSIVLTLAGYNGPIQWQSSTNGGATWVNETGVGNTSASYTTVPAQSAFYRAEVCGTMQSNTVSVTVTNVSPPTVTGDTRCGAGPVNLSASGSPTLQWFTGAFGGAAIATGSTYSPTVPGTTTYYVQGSNGTSYNLGRTNNTSGAGSMNNTYGLVFDASVGFTLNSVKIYPVGTGNVTIGLLSSTGASLNSRTVTVSGATGAAMNVYVGFYIQPGTNYKLVLSSYSGVTALYSDASGSTFPYSVPGVASITSGWNGVGTSTSYYYFYDWNILTGCVSSRSPVTATVTPADTVIINSAVSTVCNGTPVTMTATSNDQGYSYVWSPSTGLNQVTGASVVATPSTPQTYTVTATNTSSGCSSTTTKALQVASMSPVTASVTPSTVCSGNPVQLNVTTSGVAGFITIGTGTSANTSTGYPAPYGNWYWGARHQMIIRASELTAAGFTAGTSLSSIGFEVTATNGGAALQGFEIKMGNTTQTTLTTFVTGLTVVKPASTYSPVVGWNQHTFTTPFVWNGTSNVVVETCFNNSSYTNNASVKYSTTAYNSTIYYRADATGVCSSTSTPTTSTNRPNMRFGANVGFIYSWSPGATVSDSTIKNPIATPVVTTDYIAQVTNPTTGCSAYDTITVNVNQLPVVNLGNNTGICSGDTLVLDAGPGFTSYNWSNSNTTQTINVTNSGTYAVSVIDNNGCTNSDTIAVVINPSPTVSVGPDQVQCGGTVTLSSTSSGNVNYLWSTGAFTNTITVSQSGDYFLTVTNAYGCSDADTVSVQINQIPVVTLGNDTSFCPGGSIDITANTNATGATYAWSNAQSGNSITVNNPGTYSVTVTTPGGCVNSDTISVGLSPIPVADAGMDQTVCQGQGAVLTASGGNFYTWSTGANTPSVYVTPMNSTTYAVLVENAYGCMDLDTVSVFVNQNPTVSAGSNQSICIGQSTTLNATGNGTFQWSNGANTPSITVSPGVTTNYTVTVTDNNSCTASATVTVAVNSFPVANAGSDKMICENGSATLNASGGQNYFWSPATGLSSTTVSNPTASPAVSTTYTVSVVNGAGCSNTDVMVVNVNPLPVASFTNVQTGPTVTFTNSSSNAVNYNWTFGDSTPSNGNANPSHTYFDNGTYTVVLTVSNGCGTDSATTMVTVTGIGINEAELNANTSLYPNPTKGVFTLRMKDEKSSTVVLRLMDINGQLIDDATITNFGTELKKDYDISGLAKGVYYLHIVRDNTATMKKIVLD